MKNKYFTILVFASCLLGSLLSMGCQTMEGAGQDVEDAGEAIQDAAR